MFSIRKWLYKPKRNDPSLLAQFFYADEELNVIAKELDSFDGRKDPERCTALVNQLRACQDKVLNNVQVIMEEAIPRQRANRDFRVKFPDDVVHENLSGQLWFGAECLAAGSSIMNHEVESASMRPLARALTRTLDNLRALLRDQCLRNSSQYTQKIKDALIMFDQLFAEFELSYVSAMVPVKSIKEYDAMQDVVVLFSETVQRALIQNLITQEMIDDYDPALMFTIPRLAIVCGLLIFGEGPLNPDNDASSWTEMFRTFYPLLFKIRQLLLTLSDKELSLLEKVLCSSHHDVQEQVPRDAKESHSSTKHNNTEKEEEFDVVGSCMSQSASANTIIGNQDFMFNANNSLGMKHQDSRDSGICDQRAVSHESLPAGEITQSLVVENIENGFGASDVSLVVQQADDGGRFSPACNDIGASLYESVSQHHLSETSSLTDDGEMATICSKAVIDDNDEVAGTVENVTGSEVVDNLKCSNRECEAVTPKEINEDEILVESDNVLVDETTELQPPKPSLNLPNCNLLHVEDAASSACGSTNTSPSKSIYSEVASESDTYFDASDMPGTVFDDLDVTVDVPKENIPEKACDNLEDAEPVASPGSDAGSHVESAAGAVSSCDEDANNSKNPRSEDHGNTEKTVKPKLQSSKGRSTSLKSSKGSFYHSKVQDLGGHRKDDSSQQSGVKFTDNTSSSCSTCASESDLDQESCGTSDTSSYNSDCHDDEEIALAIQAAELASRNEARSRFRSSTDLIHRLFVCVSGVADQLQTNYASDLRNILRSVFEIHCSEPITQNEQLRKGQPASIRRGPISAVVPPTWVPDDQSPHCMSCKMSFTLVRRRHHCRNCGKIFCSRCSANFVPLPHFGHTKPVRVCNRCFMFQVTPFTVDESS